MMRWATIWEWLSSLVIIHKEGIVGKRNPVNLVVDHYGVRNGFCHVVAYHSLGVAAQLCDSACIHQFDQLVRREQEYICSDNVYNYYFESAGGWKLGAYYYGAVGIEGGNHADAHVITQDVLVGVIVPGTVSAL